MTTTDTRTCPYCEGEIKVAAKLCKHCKQPVPRYVEEKATLSEDEKLLRRLVVSKNLVSGDRFDEVHRGRGDASHDLLQELQEQGALTAAQASNVRAELKTQFMGEARRLGEIAVQRMMVTSEQLDKVLSDMEAQSSPPRIGEILVQQGMVTQDQADALVKGPTVGESLGDLGERLKAKTGQLSSGVSAGGGLKETVSGIPTKAKLGIGVGVAVLLAVILVVALTGGAEITENCTIDRWGKGNCEFTNKGSPGAVCGHIVAVCKDGEAAESSLICSGEVKTNETVDKPFKFPDYFDINRRYRRPLDSCPFMFIQEED